MKATVGMALAAGALTIAGCSAAQAAGDRPASPLALYDWVPGGPSMQALLQGTLENRDGCLVVVRDDSGDESIVVFPRSLVEWDASTSVLTYGGVEYRVGDHVSMAGGGLEANSSLELPEACAALAMPYVFLLQDTTLEPWTPPE